MCPTSLYISSFYGASLRLLFIPVCLVTKCFARDFDTFCLSPYMYANREPSFAAEELKDFFRGGGIAVRHDISYKSEVSGELERENRSI